MNDLLTIIISAIFVNNFVLYRFLGICPFIGVSRSTKPAFGMGIAVTLVMILVSLITWPIYHLILIPYEMQYMNIVVFILIIAAFVQLLEIIIKKYFVGLYQSLGIYLPLITTNCAIMGVALLNITKEYNFIQSITFGFSAGIGFIMVLLLMSGIREKLELGNVPKPFRGVAIAFITAAMMSMAFMVFASFPLK